MGQTGGIIKFTLHFGENSFIFIESEVLLKNGKESRKNKLKIKKID